MNASLLVSEIFPPRHGGSSRWFWEIYRRLPRETTVVAAGLNRDALAFDAGHDLQVQRLPLTLEDWGLLSRASVQGYWRAYRRLQQLLREHEQQCGAIPMVHAARCLPEGWLAWMLSKRHGLRYGVYVHGEDITTYATSRQLKFMVTRVLRRATRVIANSQNTADLLASDWGLSGDKVRVLHPGVDTKRFVPAAASDRVRQQLGWQGRRVVLTVGRLQQRKGQDRLIAALPEVRQRVPNVLYAIIGDGEQRSQLEQLVSSLNLQQHVQFLGEANDEQLVSAYQQCDLFALPNRTIGHDIEGFGMVLLEAQACGRPVLAGDSGGTRETMLPGQTGLIVDCTHVSPLAAALSKLLADPTLLDAMGQAARSWIVSRFDWEILFAAATEIFAEIASGAAQPVWRRGSTPPAVAAVGAESDTP